MANIQIDITENGTTTLATAGKYCDRNIDVNVAVPSAVTESLEVFDNGTYKPPVGVDGFSEVIVNVATSGGGSSDNDSENMLKALIDKSITSVIVPDGTTKIGDYTFYMCNSLTSAFLPEGITSIGKSAFDSCGKLAQINFPEGITKIDMYAFNGCAGLTSITLPSTITSINTSAFNNCTNLKTINVPWASGAVRNAPWGAYDATINYNVTV